MSIISHHKNVLLLDSHVLHRNQTLRMTSAKLLPMNHGEAACTPGRHTLTNKQVNDWSGITKQD